MFHAPSLSRFGASGKPGTVQDERRVELRPESTNPAHQPIQVDLENDAFEIAGVAVGAFIGDGFIGPEHESWAVWE